MLYLKADHNFVGEPFFEFDEQEIHVANHVNGYFALENLFFYFDLSLVKRSDGSNLKMSKIVEFYKSYDMAYMVWAILYESYKCLVIRFEFYFKNVEFVHF